MIFDKLKRYYVTKQIDCCSLVHTSKSINNHVYFPDLTLERSAQNTRYIQIDNSNKFDIVPKSINNYRPNYYKRTMYLKALAYTDTSFSEIAYCNQEDIYGCMLK